jgi:hypothetical protein
MKTIGPICHITYLEYLSSDSVTSHPIWNAITEKNFKKFLIYLYQSLTPNLKCQTLWLNPLYLTILCGQWNWQLFLRNKLKLWTVYSQLDTLDYKSSLELTNDVIFIFLKVNGSAWKEPKYTHFVCLHK